MAYQGVSRQIFDELVPGDELIDEHGAKMVIIDRLDEVLFFARDDDTSSFASFDEVVQNGLRVAIPEVLEEDWVEEGLD